MLGKSLFIYKKNVHPYLRYNRYKICMIMKIIIVIFDLDLHFCVLLLSLVRSIVAETKLTKWGPPVLFCFVRNVWRSFNSSPYHTFKNIT